MKVSLFPNKFFIIKIILSILLSIATIFIFYSKALACTGVYVGSDASSDGTTLIARCNDNRPLFKPAIFQVYGGNDGSKVTEVTTNNGFYWEVPQPTHRTICTPSTISTDVKSSKAAINDCGLSVSATVTGYSSETSLKYNSYVDSGINEGSIPLLVGLSCSTAKEGIDLLAQVIDQCGSAENNILMISDQNEAWYMEIYGGHQYCAIKAPNDCVAVIGNEFMIETIDTNSKDVVYSKDLFNLPAANGFAEYNADGQMNIFNSYAGKDRFVDYSHMRTWRGHQLLSPSTIGDYSATTKYPLFFKPDKKVDVTDVMDIFRDRYTGTQYDVDVNGPNSYRAISSETSQTTQILQTYKNLPANFACVDWAAFSEAEYNTFAPVSNCESIFDDAYTYSTEDFYNVDTRNAYVAYKQLNALASQNKEKIGLSVQKYWDFMEHYATWAMKQILSNDLIDNSKVQQQINDFCSSYQNQIYYDAKRLFDEVNWHLMTIDESYSPSVSLKTFKVTERNVPSYSPYVDAALIAKMFGWKVETNKLQSHEGEGSEFDGKLFFDPLQNAKNNVEGYLKISKDGNAIELHTNNGHMNSSGKLVLNGKSEKISAKLYDNKLYVDFSFVEKISQLSGNNSFCLISNSDISSKNNLNQNFWSFINLGIFPIWSIALIILIVAALSVSITCIILKRKKSIKS